jgi:peptidoglycan hydrolase-like protein with peptidoglycan-binding domain
MTIYQAQSHRSPSGYFDDNILNMARFLMANGYSRMGASGIAGCVAGESGGDPEIMESNQSGGGGLIQWTPISAYPGLITGNPTVDLNNQFQAILRFNNNSGSSISRLNAQGSPVAAADFYSQFFERPLNVNSDVRVTVANNVYAALGSPPPPPPNPWPLRQGDSGPNVVTLQGNLNKWAFATPPLIKPYDGSFGPLTKAAVVEALKHWGYPAILVGVVDEALWDHLKGTPPPVAKGTYATPIGLKAVTGATTVDLSWYPVAKATGYQVVVYNDPPALDAKKRWKPIRIDKVPGTKADITGLERGKSYQAHVWALGSPVSSQHNYAAVKFRTG